MLETRFKKWEESVLEEKLRLVFRRGLRREEKEGLIEEEWKR